MLHPELVVGLLVTRVSLLTLTSKSGVVVMLVVMWLLSFEWEVLLVVGGTGECVSFDLVGVQTNVKHEELEVSMIRTSSFVPGWGSSCLRQLTFVVSSA